MIECTIKMSSDYTSPCVTCTFRQRLIPRASYSNATYRLHVYSPAFTDIIQRQYHKEALYYIILCCKIVLVPILLAAEQSNYAYKFFRATTATRFPTSQNTV